MENLLLQLLPRRRFPIALRYAATTAFVGIALLLRLALEGPLRDYPLLLFIPAIFFAALLFDKGSGFYATVLSTLLAAFFFIDPRYSFRVPGSDLLPLAIYVAIGFTISALTEALRKTVEKLSVAEEAKSVLLQEMAHRTKNDIAMVASVLSLQARGQAEPAARRALEAAIARVGVIAKAQERLRAAETGIRVDMADYLTALCGGLGDLLRDVRPIAVRVRADPVELTSSQAVSIGLIVNELVTNAFKYAFPAGQGGAVDVEFRRRDDLVEIVVSDNGVGCPAASADGLGSRLVRLLAAQMQGSVRREPADPGCRVAVAIRLQAL